MVRFDMACKKCEKTFVLWSDEGKVCAYCGSKRIFKVFLTPPAAVTGEAARIDKLAEKQIDAAGLSNYTNAQGTIRRTRKTDPKQIEAMAAAKAANVPFQIQTGPNGVMSQATTPANVPVGLGRAIASRGKGEVTHAPKGTGAVVNNLMQTGRRFSPLSGPIAYRLPKDGGKDDSAKLKSLMR